MELRRKSQPAGRRALRIRGNVITIGQAASHYVAGVCERCEHWNYITLDEERQKHGDSYPLTEICRRLRCTICKRRGEAALTVDYSGRMKKRRGDPPAGGLTMVWWDDATISRQGG